MKIGFSARSPIYKSFMYYTSFIVAGILTECIVDITQLGSSGLFTRYILRL